jgi:hypothetical protein
MDMQGILFLILIGILFILTVLFVPYWMTLRSIPKVIQKFRQKNAIGEKNALPIDELELRPKSIFRRMFARRDYSQQGLQFLIRANVVDITEEGKFFLNEENLMLSRWKHL